jgi:hemolysin activation/secretion protein
MDGHLTMRTTTTAHFLQAFATLIALGSVAGAAQAQAPSEADREAQRILREQQELQRQQIEQQRRKLPAPESGFTTPEREVTSGNGGPCRDISIVTLDSAPNLPPADRSRIIKSYAGRCLGVRDIEQLMADVTNAYIRRGYVTARVYLPQQDLSKGRLSVMVVEGAVEKISVNGEGRGGVSVAGAFPGVQGEPLNLRDLEQGLDQINRLQSNHATLDIEPGSAPGTSRVVIHNERDRAFHLGATLDDMGGDTTGKNQAGVTGAYDSPLGFNDFVSLTYRQGLPLNVGERYSRLGSFAYFIPHGYTTGSLAYSRSDYSSFVHTASGADLQTTGDSAIASARVDQVVYRSRSSRVTLAGSLTTKSSNNYLESQLLSVSSRNLTIADLSLNYTTGLLGGVVSFEGGYSRGLKAMGSLHDAEGLAPDAPRAQFRRYNYLASYALPFRAGPLDASFATSLIGQHALTALYGSEQMLVGGIYSVRGYNRNSLAGDNGVIVRNELAVRFPIYAGGNFQSSLRPYLGLDWGRTRMREDDTGTPEGALSGATLGVALTSNAVAVEVFTSRPLHVPSYMTREGNQTYFRFSMSL